MSKPRDNPLPPELSELEDRLAHRPRLQGDPELRARVLTAAKNELRRRRRALWAAGAAIAASLLLAVGIWSAMQSPERKTDGGEGVGSRPDVIAGEATCDDPTALVYRNALLESPEALDKLLDLHAKTLLPKVSEGIDPPSWMLTATTPEQ